MKFLNIDPEGLIRFITSNLIEDHKNVKTNSFYKGKNYISIETFINKEQVGRVIGKKGKIIDAINTIVNSSNPKQYWDEAEKEYKSFNHFSIDIQE